MKKLSKILFHDYPIINVNYYMKMNSMPTNRLRIKFLKAAFLNTSILKCAIKRACLYVCYHGYTIPNKPATFKFLQSSFGKTYQVKRYLYQNESLLFVTVTFDAIA